ncbi:hypothetical protein Tco_0884804 [Tanacetum coccineum]
MPHDLPLSGGHTPGSDEGSKKLNELTELCTKLSDKVTSLEDDLKQTKNIYGKDFTKLVKKVKHLEAKLKSTTERRKARMVVFDDEEDLTDDDLQRRSIIEEIDLAKILADASREKVKTYTRKKSKSRTREKQDSCATRAFEKGPEYDLQKGGRCYEGEHGEKLIILTGILLLNKFKKDRLKTSQRHISLEDMLKGFDREDLVKLWSLVKERFRSAKPTEDKERALWLTEDVFYPE